MREPSRHGIWSWTQQREHHLTVPTGSDGVAVVAPANQGNGIRQRLVAQARPEPGF